MAALAYDALGNLAFVLTSAAYLVRDMAWLRALSIGSSLTWIAYLFTRAEVLWISVFWNGVFITINAARLAMLWRELRGVRFDAEERGLHADLFSAFSAVEFHRLLAAGCWTDLPAGRCLTVQGRAVSRVYLVCRGSVEVEIDGVRRRRVSGREFVGEIGFLTGRPASATVRAAEPVRCLVWQQAALRRLLNRHLSLRLAFHALIARDLSDKLLARPLESREPHYSEEQSP